MPHESRTEILEALADQLEALLAERKFQEALPLDDQEIRSNISVAEELLEGSWERSVRRLGALRRIQRLAERVAVGAATSLHAMLGKDPELLDAWAEIPTDLRRRFKITVAGEDVPDRKFLVEWIRGYDPEKRGD